ncbi:MAG: carbohydrate ABC transporter permease [Bacilli bacterium]|jgi:multiple sugar transport system permease protein|nr:carbohydrate ABC transporter permease [Bacilli bacterium]MCH4235864.1 carbohydrate ABC transporter permease [Bacilli bacterium]
MKTTLKNKKKKIKVSNVVITIALICVSLIAIFPFYWMVLNSLKLPNEIFKTPVDIFTFHLSLDSYISVFLAQNGMLWRAYLNSLIISTTLTIGTLFTSSLAAYAFAKLRFKGKNGIYALFIATLMIPGQVTILPLFMVFAKIGWTDTFLPLIIPGIFINTYGVFMLRQFMVSIPNELLEAAEIDGCGYFRKYLHIILPLCKPALIILGLFTFIGSWNNYFGQLIYLSSPDKMTIALFIASLKDTHANGVQWGMIMAATTLSIIPISIVYLKSQKYFVQGIATTGIK